jgi:hypothetical protein
MKFSVDEGLFVSDIRSRCVIANSEREAENELWNILQLKAQKHGKRVDRTDIDFWKTELILGDYISEVGCC